VAVLFALIEQADVIIGHNIDNFDLPCIKARSVINRFAPLKKVKTIDTLKLARQMRFPSNRLGSLGVILGEGDKASHSGISTWIGCLAGNQESLDEMLVYNIEDVDLLYRVYMRLRNHDSRPLNAGLFTLDEKVMCPVCGSHEVEETGNTVYTTVNEFKEYECNDCGSRSRSRTAVSTKQKRKTLLA
jgi:transcription elongation factor Elf1